MNIFPGEIFDKLQTTKCHGLDTPEKVYFYEPEFYVLSNFSAFKVYWKELRFDTAEAVYHWEKFPDCPDIQAEILKAPSAHLAFKIAMFNNVYKRLDWYKVRVEIMRKILREKARQHEYVTRKLLETGNRELIENSWRDAFWGEGPDKDGQNMLGKLWMDIREELRSELEKFRSKNVEK